MSTSESSSNVFRSLFGGELGGGIPLRYIYVDEAGTSAPEPVTVVVGIIVKPDEHWRAAAEEVRQAKRDVPEQYREGFIFHAKSIWGDVKFRDGWSMEERVQLIKRFASIPTRLGLSIAVGKVRRDGGGEEAIAQFGLPHSLAQWQHGMAFGSCMVAADQYLRERTDDEIATVIAEDIPEMRQHLRDATKVASALYVPAHISGSADFPSGISNITDGVQFADKSTAPLLQIADACAFSFRRFFSEQSRGDEFVQAMGINLDINEWLGPLSLKVFSHDPKLRDAPHPMKWG